MKLSLSNKYVRAVTANILFFVFSTAFFLAVTPIALRIMGEDFYGLWAILCAIMMFSNVGSLGVGSIVNKFASELVEDIDKKEYLNQVFTSGILIVLPMALIIFFLLFISRNFIASAIIHDTNIQKQFSNTLLIIGASMVPQFFSHVCQGLLLAQLENKTVRIIELIITVLLWVGSIIIVLIFGRNIVYIGIWCFVYSLISLFLYAIAIKKISKIFFRINNVLTKKMLKFSGYMFLESVSINLFSQVDRVIVGITIGPSIAGVYSIGTSVGSRLTTIVGQVTSVMIPYASLKNSTNDQEKLFYIFRKLSKYVSLFIGLLGGLAVIWMPVLLSLWITPKFAMDYKNAFIILIVAYCLLTLCRPAHQTLTGLGKVKFTSLVYLFSSLGMLMILFGTSKLFGLDGAAWADSTLVILLIFNLFVYKKYSPGKILNNLFEDLNFGIFIPLISYFVVLLQPTNLVMMVLSAIICILFGINLLKDDWIKQLLIRRLKIG